MRGRPLSPHLQVYRFFPIMALSILVRITGVWMALGMCALVYWLMSAAAGESEYGRAVALFHGWLFRALLLSWLAAFCYHLVNGLRHLAWDAGFGFEKLQARRSGRAVMLLAAVGFLIAAYLLFCPRAGAP